MTQLFILAHDVARRRAIQAVQDAPDGMVITIKEPTRNLEQNAAMWASLADVSAQVDWYGRKLTKEDWKNVFTASLKKLDVVPNLEGTGFVALGLATSRMGKREMSDLLELIAAFGAEKGVVWSNEARVEA